MVWQVTNKDNILRVAKILARSTSSEPHEASVALHAAYKRMKRDRVDVRQLLTLPLENLYQESLTKLVTLILDDQPDLSPPERRKAFQDYIFIINARFSTSGSHHGDVNASRKAQEDFRQSSENKKQHEEEVRKREEAMRKRQEEARRREEHMRQRQEAMRKSEEAARRASECAENQTDKGKRFNSQEKNTSHAGGGSTHAPSQKKKSAYGWGFIATILFLSVAIFAWINDASLDLLAGRYKTPDVVPHAKKGMDGPFFPQPAYSVAAIKANLRFKPAAAAKIKTVLKRGDELTINGVHGTFLEVQLKNGDMGFIAKELVMPSEDLSRLLQTTAPGYIARRASEKRIELLFDQAQTQKSAFLDVVHSLSNGGNFTVEYLEKMKSTQQFDIPADMSASIWFSLSASASRGAGDHEKTILETRAAIEADPVNPDHHVAFALDNYRAGNYEVVKSIGNFLPKLAPTSTNAWMLFGFANGLTAGSSSNLTKSSFVLAIKLSKNPENTRKYFRDFSVSKHHPNIRNMLDTALMEERENPRIFEGVNKISN